MEGSKEPIVRGSVGGAVGGAGSNQSALLSLIEDSPVLKLLLGTEKCKESMENCINKEC